MENDEPQKEEGTSISESEIKKLKELMRMSPLKVNKEQKTRT